MKDYERLTGNGSKYFIPEDSPNNGIVLLKDNFEEIVLNNIYNDDLCDKLNRLADLEDKIERGEIDYVAEKDKEIARLTAEVAELKARLKNAVELPVKRGDTIYCLIGFVEFLTIQEWTVQEIRLKADGKYFLICGHEGTDDYCGISSEHFGLLWFTDRSKAEARLAELGGGEGK